jgi:hypothetical protein
MALISNTGSLTITTASASFPTWYPAVGVSVVVPSSSTTAAGAANTNGASSYPGGTSLTPPWSGGGLVYVGGLPYLVVKGGGHSDSAYNGMVKFGPLYGTGSNTPSWSLFLTGSGTGAVRNASTYTDGRQAATHTYNNCVGVVDALYEMATDAYYSQGSAANNAYAFRPTGQTALASNPRSGNYGGVAHYNGNIYYMSGLNLQDQLRIYNIASNSWSTEPNGQFFLTDYPGMAVDTTRGRMYMTDGSSGWYYNLSSLARTTGRAAPSGYDYSVEYDPDRDAFVSYANALGIRELSASSLASGGNPAWTTRTFTGSAPSAGESAGTYGRFRYVPELKGYVVVPTQSSSVYFFRSA